MKKSESEEGGGLAVLVVLILVSSLLTRRPDVRVWCWVSRLTLEEGYGSSKNLVTGSIVLVLLIRVGNACSGLARVMWMWTLDKKGMAWQDMECNGIVKAVLDSVGRAANSATAAFGPCNSLLFLREPALCAQRGPSSICCKSQGQECWSRCARGASICVSCRIVAIGDCWGGIFLHCLVWVLSSHQRVGPQQAGVVDSHGSRCGPLWMCFGL